MIKNPPALVDGIKTIISRKWLGDPGQKDFPVYNLKKVFKYDINRNSRFIKKWHERIRDSTVEKSAEWTLGPLATGLIGGIATALFVLVFNVKT